MSLGIAFKGSLGIVLAADSRVTFSARLPVTDLEQPQILPIGFEHATKVLKVQGQEHLGAVTYGLGVLGRTKWRTIYSFLPAFEAELVSKAVGRLTVEEFARRLSAFFMAQWRAFMSTPARPQDHVAFLIGGYDKDSKEGRLFEISIPDHPMPRELFGANDEVGVVWGGQQRFIQRLLFGYDPDLLAMAQLELGLSSEAQSKLSDKVKELSIAIRYQSFTLQDCIDFATFLIQTTIMLQSWQLGLPASADGIDVATVTESDRFRIVQQSKLT